jgi:hypothetical protein
MLWAITHLPIPLLVAALHKEHYECNTEANTGSNEPVAAKDPSAEKEWDIKKHE